MRSVIDLTEGSLLRAAHGGRSGQDQWKWFCVLAAPDARALRRSRPSKIETAKGRPGAGRARGPPANKKSWRQSPQVWPKHPGPPCAMVLALIARSPWGPGFLAP